VPPKNTDDRSSADLDAILKDVAKKFEVNVGSMSSVVAPVESLTTGNLAIDYLTGIGGLPIGRITELYGQPAAGKSTTALQTAAEAQKRIITTGSDERILYFDYEHALDEEYAASLGLDVEHPTFLLAQPYWLEQGAEAARRIIASNKVRLCIWDSVAEMTPKSTLDAEFDRRTGAMERARQMKELLARMTPLIDQHRCAMVFLNHAMESLDMGGRPGMPPAETTPGGKALKFYSSLRMSYKQVKQIKGKHLDALTGEITDQVVAVDTKVKVTKNKLASPFREAIVRVRFGRGFDNIWSALQVLIAYKHVVLGAAGYHYFDSKHAPELAHPDMSRSATGRPTIQAEANVLKFADTHPDWREQVVKHAVAVVEAQGEDTVPGGDAPTDPFTGEELTPAG
jgi:recombination protein RecA